MRRRITRTLFAAAAAGVTVSTLGLAAAGAASAAVSSKAQPGHHRNHASPRTSVGGVRGERAGLPLHQLDHHGPGHLVS